MKLKDYTIFKKELIELMKKHEIVIASHDDYDGADNYCGTNYSFVKEDDGYGGFTLKDI